MHIKKMITLASVLCLVVMVVLAFTVFRLTRFRETDNPPIMSELSQGQLAHLPTMGVNPPQRIQPPPERQNRASLPVPDSAKPEQAPQPEEAYSLEGGDLLRENLPDMLAWAIEEDFPDMNLSESAFQELTEAVMIIRASMQGLRETKETSENADAVVKMRDALNQAKRDFRRITGMHMEEFILRAPANRDLDYRYLDDERINLENFTNAIQ